MKNISLSLVAALALGFSSTAFAQAVDIENGVAITTTECSVLTEPVRLLLSKGVVGQYDCDEDEVKTRIATCHTAGWKATSLICAIIDFDTENAPIYNDGECTTAGEVIDKAATPAFRGYTGSSAGGSVADVSLAGSCTDAASAGAILD